MLHALSRPLLTVEEVGDVSVIRFHTPRILEQDVSVALGAELTKYLEWSQRRSLLLDFEGVTQLSTTFITKLFWLQRTMARDGGSVLFCRVHPNLREIFELTGLGHLLCSAPVSVGLASA